MENIVVAYVDSSEHANYFSKIVCSNNKNIIFITNSFSTYLILRFKHEQVRLLSRNISYVYNLENIDYDYTLDYVIKLVDRKKALNLSRRLINTLDEVHKEYNIEYMLLWNGCKIGDKVCRYYAGINGIKCIFFEIANIPGKVFVDCLGTNKNSSINIYPKILDTKITQVTEKKYINWHEKYLNEKLGNYILPQSKKKATIVSLGSNFMNLIASVFNLCETKPLFFLKNIMEILKNRITIPVDDINFSRLPKYIFLPLQVHNDTQVLLNSKVGLYDLIDFGVDAARKEDCALIIKPHPAEKNKDVLQYILDKKKSFGNIFISNVNTFKLINQSDYVITINSTVGLEAMILGKPVKVLGEAFYTKFNDTRLKNYIVNYLVDIDYFSINDYRKGDFDKVISHYEYLRKRILDLKSNH